MSRHGSNNKGSRPGRRFRGIAFALLVCATAASAQSLPPLEAFARRPAVSSVALSPDGRYVSYIDNREADRDAVILDRTSSKSTLQAVLRSREDDILSLVSCRWASGARLVCELERSVLLDPLQRQVFCELSQPACVPTTPILSMEESFKKTQQRTLVPLKVSRLVGLDADGANLLDLGDYVPPSLLQRSRIVDVMPAGPPAVLVESKRTGTSDFAMVQRLDATSGERKQDTPAYAPIRAFFTDGRGEVRFGYGFAKGVVSYYARLAGAERWLRLEEFPLFQRPGDNVPLAVTPGGNDLYYLAPHEGRQAVWRRDLSGTQAGQLVFSSATEDFDRAVYSSRGKLLGFAVFGRPGGIEYLDPRTKEVIESVNALVPDKQNRILDVSQDEKVYVIESSSSADAGTYSIVDATESAIKLKRLGSAYPELEKYPAARTRTVTYPARDGATIPAYLTLPATDTPNPPLIVLPHDGPARRDTGEFDFLRNFLASRGYAVLQMNYRGSAGLGWEWQKAGLQNWGGVIYDDIVDGARWATTSGIADPKRTCVLGWGFGGYTALLGATRNPELFRCSISIGGITDLVSFKRLAVQTSDLRALDLSIGSPTSKLLSNSPLTAASQARSPILLIHGELDAEVNVAQSQAMARTLQINGKPHELVVVPGGEHDLRRESDRKTLLSTVERFLATHCSAGPSP